MATNSIGKGLYAAPQGLNDDGDVLEIEIETPMTELGITELPDGSVEIDLEGKGG